MKPEHYEIGIDTFERMRANATYEEAMGFIRWNIDKYNTRKKGQEASDYRKIIAYCNEALWWIENDVDLTKLESKLFISKEPTTEELMNNPKPILRMDKNYYNEIWPELENMGWYRESEEDIFWHHANSNKILEVLGSGDINVLTKTDYKEWHLIEYGCNMYNEVDKLIT